MPLVAVTGIPGSGKSTVLAALKAAGLVAFGTDEDGLAEWRDASTRRPVNEPADWHDPQLTAGLEYRVRRDRIEAIRSDAVDRTVFVCGFAGDEAEMLDLLDVVVCLAVDSATLQHRLATRTTNDFGKAAHEREATLAANEGWAASYRERGAVIVDGNLPVNDVVAAIVAAAEGATHRTVSPVPAAGRTEQHEANRRHWDRSAARWKEIRDRDGLWRRCAAEPELAFEAGVWELIGQLLGDFVGRRACVIGAGDAYAAFALAGAGAAVTAVDISQAQLDVAAARAGVLGLPLELVRADAADLHEVASDQFDLVVSTNGFFVWIADLTPVFAEVHRILRPAGSYVFYDVHPFQRPVEAVDDGIAIDKSYWATGPHVDGDTFEYHWTVSDVLNALAGAGLHVAAVRETPPRDGRYWTDGHYQPDETDVFETDGGSLAALPAWLAVATTRR